jgi:phosphoserine phosphatase RsbU/P
MRAETAVDWRDNTGRLAVLAERVAPDHAAPANAKEVELERHIEAIVHDWSKTLAVLGFTLVPVFFILDYFIMPAELLPRFAIYRLVCTGLVIAQYAVLRATRPGPFTHLHGFVLSVIVGGTIALMTTHLGGFNSSYYAGLNLVLIATNLVLPWRAIYSSANTLVIIGLYVLLNVFTPSEPIDTRILLNNMYFLSATGVITVAMNYVQHRLIRQEFLLRSDLKAARDALWGEMEIAKHIQTSLLPRLHRVQDYKVAATMLPAEEVGGDYYDIITGRTGETWVCIGDVSGHGVESGLIMMMTQTSIRTVLTGAPGGLPCDVLQRVNSVIKQNITRLGTDRYMTLCLLRLAEDEITFAGRHQDLLIYRAGTGVVEAVPTDGAWLGVVDDLSKATPNHRLPVSPGDVMLLFTDGITEATNRAGDLFGDERLRQALVRYSHLPVEEIVDNIVRDVRSHVDTQQDDISLVALKRT